jgi:hypothetical protein
MRQLAVFMAGDSTPMGSERKRATWFGSAPVSVSVAQRAKSPYLFCGVCGTTEVVPFQNKGIFNRRLLCGGLETPATAGLDRLRKKPERKVNSAKDGLAGAKQAAEKLAFARCFELL